MKKEKTTELSEASETMASATEKNTATILILDDKLPDGVSEKQWNSWKDKWGDKLKRLHLPLNDDSSEFLTVAALVPERKTVCDFEMNSDKNPKKAREILINDCVISNKDSVLADDALFFTAANALIELIPIRKHVIKN